MGCERNDAVAPGLGLAAPAGMEFFGEIIEQYRKDRFVADSGEVNLKTVVARTTDVLRQYGFRGCGEREQVAGIYIYPPDYFCPLDYQTGEMSVTPNTRSIHHYMASWKRPEELQMEKITAQLEARFGAVGTRLAGFIVLPIRLHMKVRQIGIWRTAVLAVSKLRLKGDR